MIFRKGAAVETADGKEIGHLDRVVIDPTHDEVTHLVVRHGLLLVDDKLLPVGMVASSGEDSVTLKPEASDFSQLPPFEETHFVPAVDSSPVAPEERKPTPLYWYPPILGFEPPGYAGPLIYGYPGPEYIAETERNTPPGTVALKVGARVKTRDGEDAGHIDEIITQAGTDRVTHLVVAQGTVAPIRRLIPAQWIQKAQDGEVQLAVAAGVLEALEPYQT